MTRFGTPRRHLRVTDSTNLRAKELAAAGAPHGLVVTADEQESGRGRTGRSWFGHPASTLLYSAVLRPLGGRPLLPLAVPLAVCEAAESVADVECRVKWPNDVWIENRKLAGVLIESRPETGAGGWAVIGIGLNVSVGREDFPEELRETATSLAIASGGAAPARDEVLAALNERLGAWVDSDDTEVLAAFRRRDALAGRELSWDGGSGVAAGVDDAGHLLVDVPGGERVTLGAGEVHLKLG